jgi:alanine dehydrogenase
MLIIALLKEGKIPADNRVALSPDQCRWILEHYPNVKIVVQSSLHRCFSDVEYERVGIEVKDDISGSDILIGIKEVPVAEILPDKTYLFFSHTKKKQPHNQLLLKRIVQNKVTLIDYECLEHEDGQRILGFGFFAGIVGAHNGMMAYGRRTGIYNLERVHKQSSLRKLVHTYFGLKLPPLKIAVTGSGRVASGILEIMNLMGIIEVEPEEYLEKNFSYPVFVHLKGPNLYAHKETGGYKRDDFHLHPDHYNSLFHPYAKETDILMNGIYWDNLIPRLFEWEHMQQESFRIQTIADITDDINGSIPCNITSGTIEDPVYGVNPRTREITEPYRQGCVDVIAVGNLPNELPRDASRYFGEQLIKYIFDDLVKGGSPVIEHATMVRQGALTAPYLYLKDFVE